MTHITVEYSDVKSAIRQMKNILHDIYDIPAQEITMKKSFFHDFGLYGDEWDIFISKFEATFNFNLAGLEYEEYFPEEGDLKHFYLLPLRMLNFPFKFLKHRYSTSVHKLLYPTFYAKRRLTVGDMVASVLAARFVEKKNVCFKLLY